MIRFVVISLQVYSQCFTFSESIIIGPSNTSNDVSYLPPTTCSKPHISSSLRGSAPCQPRDKVIVVPWPNNTDVHRVTPTHVTVRRCSGGCHQDHQSCVASLTRVREVQVILGKCPVSGGKCEKECASVKVEDEVECECGCRRKECGEKAEWMSDTCECECKDSVGRTECLESGYVWDSTQCQCGCPAILSCHSGMEFSKESCQCHPTISKKDMEMVNKAKRSDRENVFTWEHIVIIILGFLLFLFLIVIIFLTKRIQRLKYCSSSTHLASAFSENIYTQCPINEKEKERTSRLENLGAKNPSPEVDHLQLFDSSSDLSTQMQYCSDKHTDSSVISDSESDHISPHRQTPSINTNYQPYIYHNMPTVQEHAASESCSLMSRETNI